MLIVASMSPASAAGLGVNAALPLASSAASNATQIQFRGRGGGYRGGYRGGFRGGGGLGIAGAILGGAVIGGALASPYYARPYYSYPRTYAYPAYGYSGGGDDAYCFNQFRSYDPRTGTYLGYDGYRHPCP